MPREEKFLFEENKKQLFLSKLKGNNRKYKRYTGSPLRYGGGKSLAVGYIIELLPDNITKVISPFIGGGSVEIALSKELGINVIAYDVFDLLVNYWQMQLKNPNRLY
ncbi:MAG: DNA adenine methylase, partial [Bacteroidota bacterium]|nr:DNA adenine methylase [Bacteroidota bacterium]